jgi:mono/diheme cytochrome c family protein
MKQVLYRNPLNFLFGAFLTLLLFTPTSLMAQDQLGDAAKGKQLFNQNCAACHALNRKMTGPALAGVYDKYDGDIEWLRKWIKNNQSLIKAGDERALAIYNEYNQTAMNAFPTLSDQDISDILAYTQAPPPAPVQAVPTTSTAQPSTGSGVSQEVLLGALAVVLGLLVMMLYLVTKTLKRFATANGIEVKVTKRKSIWKAYVQNQFLILVTVILLLLASAYQMYGYFMQIGVDQGYAPIQPIHFSHKIHAGDNKIDCKFCHSSARTSKYSGIPSLENCMNCHKSIYEYKGNSEGPSAEDLANGYTNEFYTGEIKKLYAAVGWDENNQEYTGESKPVEWVRVHKLPDFAYFNHSQHVTVAGVQCQTCHGPVETMEILEQYSPLTMGWCINCHRTTNVNVKDNKYYESIHKALSEKYGVEELTAAQMGGLECGKCHY